MIIFSRNTLREALTGLRVLKVSKQSLPVLRHVYVFGFEKSVQIDATNLDQYLRYEGDAENTTVTRLLMPFDVLDTAGKSADANSEIRITGGDQPRIGYSVGGASLDVPFATIDLKEFPEKPVAENEPIALPAGLLGTMHEALACASTDATRYILNSVYLDAHAVVATNGRQLYRRNSLELPMTEGAIFPASPVPGILPDEAAHLWRWHHKDHPYAQIAVGRWTWITKLVEGNFPNYQQVIPKMDNYGGLVRISEPDAARILSVVPKLPGFKDRDSKVVLSVTDKGAELRTASNLPKVHLALDRSEVVRPATSDVAFNSRFLISALQQGLRELHARDHMSPLVMTESNRLHMWMPLRDVAPPPAAKEPEATASSDPTVPSQVVQKPAEQVPPVSETNVSETTKPTTTMVASTKPVSETREDAGKPVVVAPSRITTESPASAADALQAKLGKIRDLLRDLGNEIGGVQALVRDSSRQFKTLERDHETLRKNIRALREVPV